MSDTTRKQLTWAIIKKLALAAVKSKELDGEYVRRLEFEIKEIEKQGANTYWTEQYNERIKYTTNKNGLVLPWLLRLTPVDPLMSPHKMTLSTDLPDIDVDCLPSARDKIKAYAAKKYGDEYVCSVGTWLTFKFKSALQDAVRGLTGGGEHLKEIMAITKILPDDVDNLKDGGYSKCTKCGARHKLVECPDCGGSDTDGLTIGQVLEEYDVLREYAKKNQSIVDHAVRLVGKIRSMGKHAGGVIISNTKLLGNVPMKLSKGTNGEAQWTSMWTEGRNPQLSKLGYVKWDLLGLKTLQYIHEACVLAGKTRGCKFNALPWKDNDPEIESAGWYLDPDGVKHIVSMSDPAVFKMINDLRLETIFQFETDVQRNVLSNGVRNYLDLQVFNAMGHPGPIAFIPEYVERRDDTAQNWKIYEHPEIAAELEVTHGIIVYQEQLQSLWQKFAGFTAPEAEAARKAVAKKWTEKLKGIEAQWMKGASKTIGKEWAATMWERMISFGRYAFNKSHSTAYILVAYWCAWLKTHFPPEWWAAVMSGCHSDRIPTYMNTARLENVKFGFINAEKLTQKFSVDADLQVTPGLMSIKGIGAKAAWGLEGSQEYRDVDHFVEVNGKNKRVMEPLIKLGAFAKWHPNTRAAWSWYQYKYCSGKDITAMRRRVRAELVVDWTPELIAERIAKDSEGFKLLHPKRKIPNKIKNWKPKPDDTRENVIALVDADFPLEEVLAFEKQYLGYYWHSPLDLYKTTPGHTIKNIKDSIDGRGKIECVVEQLAIGKTRNQKKMGRLKVTDGLSNCTIILWAKQLAVLQPYLKEGFGMSIAVKYDSSRNSFTLAGRDTLPDELELIDEKRD